MDLEDISDYILSLFLVYSMPVYASALFNTLWALTRYLLWWIFFTLRALRRLYFELGVSLFLTWSSLEPEEVMDRIYEGKKAKRESRSRRPLPRSSRGRGRALRNR